MANQRWSTNKNIQFINEYQRQECLWDPKHLQYKNWDARDAAYKIIMEAMEMQNVKEVVAKIRSLRNTYNNELLKAKKSNTTGMATNDLYISKIPWQCHLDFLKNIDSYTRENTENVAPNTQATSTSESESQDFTVSSIPTRNKRKIKGPLLQAVDALEKVSTQHFSNATNDEFDLFGQTQQLNNCDHDGKSFSSDEEEAIEGGAIQRETIEEGAVEEEVAIDGVENEASAEADEVETVSKTYRMSPSDGDTCHATTS
ncbi:unnamed protein product [Arctia plantaginis]|uniref:MADF domain-containing protein n=1 Tax=Arctia plantaginis TaxID=874455 RepID=A0A8S1AV08_ARCPL|nr:unnamed protein product [Arctia plantaginis]